MAYDIKLADRIREALVERGLENVEEKKMFSGLCFMLNGKIRLCAAHNELMCRIGHDYKQALELNGVRGMLRNGKALKDYVYVSQDILKTKLQFDTWVDKAIAFNKFAKASKS
ncbi:MAG: TfoX/Sxy family protein [Bacteroidota bacterium]